MAAQACAKQGAEPLQGIALQIQLELERTGTPACAGLRAERQPPRCIQKGRLEALQIQQARLQPQRYQPVAEQRIGLLAQIQLQLRAIPTTFLLQGSTELGGRSEQRSQHGLEITTDLHCPCAELQLRPERSDRLEAGVAVAKHQARHRHLQGGLGTNRDQRFEPKRLGCTLAPSQPLPSS